MNSFSRHPFSQKGLRALLIFRGHHAKNRRAGISGNSEILDNLGPCQVMADQLEQPSPFRLIFCRGAVARRKSSRQTRWQLAHRRPVAMTLHDRTPAELFVGESAGEDISGMPASPQVQHQVFGFVSPQKTSGFAGGQTLPDHGSISPRGSILYRQITAELRVKISDFYASTELGMTKCSSLAYAVVECPCRIHLRTYPRLLRKSHCRLSRRRFYCDQSSCPTNRKVSFTRGKVIP
jgi:hypothetical protein